MTHLRIEQAEGSTEYISSAGAKKLYELCKNSTFDNASNLQGTCHIQGGGYAVYKTYLETMFPNFHLTMDREYFVIQDSEFENVLAQNWGDGTGITAAQLLNVKDTTRNNWIPAEILSNTSITDLTELQYCTGIAGNDQTNYFSWRNHFESMHSLQKIVFPNTILGIWGRYGGFIFSGTGAPGMSSTSMNDLRYVDFNGIPDLSCVFGGEFPNLETVILGEGCVSCTQFLTEVTAVTNITSFSIPSTLQKITGIQETKITSLTIPGTLTFLGGCRYNPLLQEIIFQDSNNPLTIDGSGSWNSGTFSFCPLIQTIIFPDRDITFTDQYQMGSMESLTTIVFKRKPVSINWSKFTLRRTQGMQTNNLTDMYFPDADYEDMVADIQAANSNYTYVTFHKLSDYPGTL